VELYTHPLIDYQKGQLPKEAATQTGSYLLGPVDRTLVPSNSAKLGGNKLRIGSRKNRPDDMDISDC
jgi:hypothetical protein